MDDYFETIPKEFELDAPAWVWNPHPWSYKIQFEQGNRYDANRNWFTKSSRVPRDYQLKTPGPGNENIQNCIQTNRGKQWVRYNLENRSNRNTKIVQIQSYYGQSFKKKEEPIEACKYQLNYAKINKRIYFPMKRQ
ncbi:UNKNOWN [Stylonychia lemnae]|uniref:Uncharacterized protein n=1 Tax=Stylonychia lemnae TaxID=5949 RepID=A0A078AK12_STYLE|nr:UNKNOWN [Stylonychia lemnae]|eukprot:CDW82509.1 UNKNOWN [Stylonychia lemnae]